MPSLDLPRPVRRPYGRLPSGEAVDVWTLDDGHGLTARVLTYGGILQSLDVPDAHGRSDNVVLGFTGLADYLHRSPYFGATVGRYANRIRAGRFDLDGTQVRLPLNDPPRSNTLHGGPHGFSTRLWTAESLARPGACGVTLRLTSPDGDEGFPGTLHVTVTYLVRRAELHIEYQAVTDAATVVNLTNHSYFNLAGEGADKVLDHELTVAAGEYLPVDDQLIPIAEAPLPVAGTPFDHREPRLLRDGVISPHQQVRLAGGFDHCWVLGRAPAPGPRAAARLVHRGSGPVGLDGAAQGVGHPVVALEELRLGRVRRRCLPVAVAGQEPVEGHGRHGSTAQSGQDMPRVVEEALMGTHDEDLVGRAVVVIEQPHHPVEADGRLAGTRTALDDKGARALVGYQQQLFALHCLHKVARGPVARQVEVVDQQIA
nr:aldose epimerase family protein [Actinacidiphila soli]